MTVLRRLLDLNRAASFRVAKKLNRDPESPFIEFENAVNRILSETSNERRWLLDVGGGRSSQFAGAAAAKDIQVVAFDISAQELAANDRVSLKVVGDAGQRLPFKDASFDIVISRTVLEHVRGVEVFINESKRILKPGGAAIHLFPCTFAPFAVVTKIVPFPVAKMVLHTFRPESKGVVEFPPFYEDCWPSKMSALHAAAGFDNIRLRSFYYQANYFDAMFPVYLINVAYETIIERLNVQDLAAYAVIVARSEG